MKHPKMTAAALMAGLLLAGCGSAGHPAAAPRASSRAPASAPASAPSPVASSAAPSPSGPSCPSARVVGSTLGITVPAPQAASPASDPAVPFPPGAASTDCSYQARSTAVTVTLADGVPASYFGAVQQFDQGTSSQLTLIPPGRLGLGKQAGYFMMTYTPENSSQSEPIIGVMAVKNGRFLEVETVGLPFTSAGQVALLASRVAD